jgi:hypothetical protein
MRAAFTLTVISVVLVAAALLVALISIIAGIGEGMTYAWSVFWRNSDVKGIGSQYWRAVTLREAA